MMKSWSFFIFAALAIGLAAPPVGAVDWETPQRLTTNVAYSGYPAIALSGSSTVVVAWHDKSHGEHEIYAVRSVNRGDDWLAPQRLTDSASDSRFPQLAATSTGEVHLVFQDNRRDVRGQQYDVFYLRSDNNGGTWEDVRRIVSNGGRSIRPVIETSGSNVFLAWSDITGGMFDVYFRRSLNRGADWEEPVQMTSKPDSLDPDTGLPQQPPSLMPRLAVDGNRLALAWHDGRHDREILRRPYPDNYEIYLQTSTNNGAAWQTAQRLTNEAQESTNADVAWTASGPITAWSDGRTGNRDIYLKADQQATIAVSPGPHPSMHPRLVANGDRLGLFWHDNRDDVEASWQVYFAESLDGGQTWSPAQQLTNAPRFAGFCDVASDGQSYYLVYMNDRFADPNLRGENNFEIMFMRGQ